jgi:putative flippase GtrA
MRKLLTAYIDFFYPPFKKLMPLQTFRYASCGGGNTLLGLSLFYILHHFAFSNENVDAGFMVFESYSAALFISFVVTFVVGFLLNKYVVFTSSNLRGRIQLVRYFLSFFINLIINYFLLKMFVEYLNMEAFLSQVITTTIIVSISYLTQKHFTFKEVG